MWNYPLVAPKISHMTDPKILIKLCHTYTDLAKRLGYTADSNGIRKAKKFIRQYELDTSHFTAAKGSTDYRKICFEHHPHECIICGEFRVVEVHHYDEDHFNNAVDNLIPLCPTHHQYWHSRHINLVKPQVDVFRNQFMKKSST